MTHFVFAHNIDMRQPDFNNLQEISKVIRPILNPPTRFVLLHHYRILININLKNHWPYILGHNV